MSGGHSSEGHLRQQVGFLCARETHPLDAMEDLCSCRPQIAITLYTDQVWEKYDDVGFRVDMGACRAQIERNIEE